MRNNRARHTLAEQAWIAGDSQILACAMPNKHTAYKYKRPTLYPKQKAAIFSAVRYSWIEASTKSGKTHGCLVWLLEQALRGKPGQNFWWVAPSYGQASMAYKRLQRGLKYVKHDVEEVNISISATLGLYRPNETEHRITLGNGSVIWFRSGEKPDLLYGEDVYAVVIDEASRIREESFHAIRSTLTATKGPIRIIGNVKGRGNWFYKGSRNAKAGKSGHEYHMITAWDAVEAGVLDKEEIEDARQVLPDHVFAELYECKPSDDGWNPFGLAAIKSCIIPRMSLGIPVAAGWDLGRKVDYTVGVMLTARGEQCGFDRFQMPWREAVLRIREKTGAVPALVDSTGMGDPVLDFIQRPYASVDHGGNGGHHTIKRAAYAGNFEGFIFSAPSKQELIEDLVFAIQSQMIHYVEGVIVDELEQFEYVHTRTGVKYSAPEGCHDDAVMALALAWRKFKSRRAPASIR